MRCHSLCTIQCYAGCLQPRPKVRFTLLDLAAPSPLKAETSSMYVRGNVTAEKHGLKKRERFLCNRIVKYEDPLHDSKSYRMAVLC